MDYTDDDGTALVEALTLRRETGWPVTPLYQGYGRNPEYWNWWGGPYRVPPGHNPKNKKDIEYLNSDGVRHRLGGPAYISTLYDIEIWYKDGKMHRVGGPAYRHRRNLVWYHEGVLSRADGPAVVELGGPKQYWLDGIRYPEKQYRLEIKRRKRRGLL